MDRPRYSLVSMNSSRSVRINDTRVRKLVAPWVVSLLFSACSGQPAGAPAPAVPPSYAALRDTLVCVIDRSSPRGLREIPAKVDGQTVVLWSDERITPLESLHPVNVIAGYAGREGWLIRGEPILLDGGRYARTGGERRVAPSLVRRAGEHQGILLFAGEEDPPPADALYIPTAPGCVFQPYVREDLIRR